MFPLPFVFVPKREGEAVRRSIYKLRHQVSNIKPRCCCLFTPAGVNSILVWQKALLLWTSVCAETFLWHGYKRCPSMRSLCKCQMDLWLTEPVFGPRFFFSAFSLSSSSMFSLSISVIRVLHRLWSSCTTHQRRRGTHKERLVKGF